MTEHGTGASWQEIAGSLALSLRLMAVLVEAARAGDTADGPVVFPSIREALEDSEAMGEEDCPEGIDGGES
jgi:hypothetical protein